MSGGAATTCRRDGTPTQLTCTQCGAPICPRCLVRTSVGMRCLDCAETGRSSPPARGRRPAAIGGLVAVAVVAVVAVRALGGGDSGGSTTPVAATSQRVSRPDLGFSIDLPPTWVVDADQTPGSIFFARSTPAKSSLRLFRSETDQTLDQTMVNVTEGLRQQGASDFSQQPVEVGGLPGIRLDYLAADGPGGTSATHSAYRVKRGNVVFSLSLATTDPSERTVLVDIASTFRLL